MTSQDALANGPTGTLLVVDDNEMNRDMLSRRLERRGFKVALADGGQRALDMCAEQSFDLILLDIMMPGIDGIEVLKRLREKHSPAELPIIMVTAKDGSEDVVGALKFGANDYVTKPVDFPVVLARTHTQLALRQAQVALRQKMEEVQRLARDLEKRNGFIRSVFGRYLTDDVVNSILDTPDGLALGGQKRKVTIVMSDLRGFSALSERLPPEQVVAFLNHYLGAMADIISAHQGTIDEFIGDAILCIFGAPVQRPDDAERAVACAIHMQRAMEDVNRHFAASGLPPVEMGIGINTGEVVVGNIGSNRRAKYGVVGSHVNLAGRVESYTVGGQLLVSDSTAAEMRDTLMVKRSFSMDAKGFKDPITVHEVLGLGGTHNVFLPEETEDLRALPAPRAVQVGVLEGKHGSGVSFGAHAVRLGQRHAELSGVPGVPVGSNLKVMWTSDDGQPCETYVKVLTALPDGTTALCRFTAVTPEAHRLLQGLRAG